MKRLNWSLIVLNTISAAAVSVFVVYTLIQVNIQNATPFDMSNAYIEINVTNHYPINVSDNKILLEQIGKIVKNNEVIIVLDNIDSLGLAVYDPKGMFQSYPLKAGTYLSSKDFKQNTSFILVKENSFVYNYSVDHDNVYDINGETFQVKGVYDSQHPLYTNKREYVYNYFEATDLRGHYYIDTQNKGVVNEIVDLLTQNNYACNIIRSGSEKPLKNITKRLMSNSSYMTTLFGIVFIYSNYYLFYRVFLLKSWKISKIHLRFGATKFKLLLRYSKDILLNLFLGSILGAVFYLLVFQTGSLELPLWLLAVVVVSNMTISYLIYVLDFCFQKKLEF